MREVISSAYGPSSMGQAVYGSAREAIAAFERGGRVGQFPPSCATFEAEQKKVWALFVALDAAKVACGTASPSKFDAPTLAAYEALRARVLAFANEGCFFLTITDNDVERGRQLEREIATWWAKLKQLGCVGDVPQPSLPPKQAGGLGDLFGDVKGVLLLLVAMEFFKSRR